MKKGGAKMMVKKTICLALLFICLFGVSNITSFASAEKISTSAHSAVLYLPETHSFLYAKNADTRMAMASTTKIMTALIVLENSNLDDIVTIPQQAVGTEGSSAYLKVGEKLTIEEMLYALLLQSANDVAVSLADHIGGDIEGFAELMNSRAESLGLVDTHFSNPHGLDDKEHYTTARELSIIAAEAMKNDIFRQIVSTKKKSFVTEERSRTYINHNKLLALYDDCIGVKTGFTKKSGRCLVSAAERDGLTFISVTLNAPNDWSDHTDLLNYGYSRIEKITLCNSEDYKYSLPIINLEGESVLVTNKESRFIISERGDNNVEEHVRIYRYAIAPVEEGDVLGEVIYTKNGEEISRVQLVACQTVEKQSKLIDKIFSLFK